MSSAVPGSVIADIRFIGRSGGVVKLLSGFKKKHHTLPDAANPVTNAFLGRLCTGELEEEAEKLFQAVRTKLGYKRKDVALTLTSPSAVLAAKDFTFEILYELDPAAPAEFAVTQTLLDVKDGDFARTEAFNTIFDGRFSELSFTLRKGARVEAVIDAIEGLDDETVMRVDYPSDCSECTISVEGVEAQVRCTGASLDMVFPRAGAPQELLEQFTAVRSAFRLSKTLSGLVA
jgi:hypothetical protein|uniref:hypothetical protein n=1 Tax=Cephaloticoccus sp. TaxID=1985742 RepID=UPI0040490091